MAMHFAPFNAGDTKATTVCVKQASPLLLKSYNKKRSAVGFHLPRLSGGQPIFLHSFSSHLPIRYMVSFSGVFVNRWKKKVGKVSGFFHLLGNLFAKTKIVCLWIYRKRSIHSKKRGQKRKSKKNKKILKKVLTNVFWFDII